MTFLRALSVVRAAYGVALLTAPAAMAMTLGAGDFPSARVGRDVARVLGARHLAQAAICAARPCRSTALLGLVADAAHAASMAYLARRVTAWQRPASRSAAVAGTFTIADALAVARAAA